jgi:hypothetical protein
MVVGGFYPDAQSQTTLADKANNERVLWVASNDDLGFGGGVAVTGYSAKAVGLEGFSKTGTGVYGHADSTGYAFKGSGRLLFDKVSGVATIAAGATSIVITPGVNVTSSSFVLLTPMSNIGARSVYATVDATNDRITVHLSSSRTSSTRVGWLLLR